MHDSTAMENRARVQQRLLLVVDAKICKTGKRAGLGTRQALRNFVLSSFFVLLEPGCAGILLLALLAKHKVASSTLQGSDFGLSKTMCDFDQSC